MAITVSVSSFPITRENVELHMWVVYPDSEDAIGIITELKAGENDKYVSIAWFDGGSTQHPLLELIDEGFILGAVATSTLPEWAK
jgi:hypothetical protein